jgi:hypothetical protein
MRLRPGRGCQRLVFAWRLVQNFYDPSAAIIVASSRAVRASVSKLTDRAWGLALGEHSAVADLRADLLGQSCE